MSFCFVLKIRRPPVSTRTDTLFPYTTLFRSGLVNATDVTVGDALYVGTPVEFPRLPEFAPEHFQVARVKDTGRFKQFRRGIAQLDEEGVVQVLRDPDLGDQAPMLAAVGPMQFEVRSEEHTSELQSLMRISYAVFCLKKTNHITYEHTHITQN